MPWTKEDYPDSLKNFMAPVRNKAIEIANALLEDGYEEGRAIAIATAQAKEWGENHDKQIRKKIRSTCCTRSQADSIKRTRRQLTVWSFCSVR